jgi:hypothetical protein
VIRMIARFYHECVPFLRTTLEAKFVGRLPISVFVSHSGYNKESYAVPLTNHFKEIGVDEVFLDKNRKMGETTK